MPRGCIYDSLKLRPRVSATVFHATRNLQLYHDTYELGGKYYSTLGKLSHGWGYYGPQCKVRQYLPLGYGMVYSIRGLRAYTEFYRGYLTSDEAEALA